jgi:hypothetical protein
MIDYSAILESFIIGNESIVSDIKDKIKDTKDKIDIRLKDRDESSSDNDNSSNSKEKYQDTANRYGITLRIDPISSEEAEEKGLTNSARRFADLALKDIKKIVERCKESGSLRSELDQKLISNIRSDPKYMESGYVQNSKKLFKKISPYVKYANKDEMAFVIADTSGKEADLIGIISKICCDLLNYKYSAVLKSAHYGKFHVTEDSKGIIRVG